MTAHETDVQTYDLRCIERRLRDGVIDRKEYDRYLASLPDDAENADAIDMVEDLDDEFTPQFEGPTFTSG